MLYVLLYIHFIFIRLSNVLYSCHIFLFFKLFDYMLIIENLKLFFRYLKYENFYYIVFTRHSAGKV